MVATLLGDRSGGAGNNYLPTSRSCDRQFLADPESTNKNRLVTGETYEMFADFIAFIHRLHAEADAAVEIEEPVGVEAKQETVVALVVNYRYEHSTFH